MYIKEIEIKGFRNFKEAKVPFHEGVNVIIWHNNTGKSNLLRALGLVLGYYTHRDLHTNDLFYETDIAVLQAQSPRLNITITPAETIQWSFIVHSSCRKASVTFSERVRCQNLQIGFKPLDKAFVLFNLLREVFEQLVLQTILLALVAFFRL